MTLIVTFFVVFVVGPLLFWKLARRRPSRRRIALLMASALLLVLAAFGTGQWLVPMLAPNPYPGLAAICAIWLAWILVLAYCALALQYRLTSKFARRTIIAVGAMATTLPWFGLSAAQYMAPR